MTVSFTSSATDIFPSLLFPFEEAVVGLERTSYNLSEGNELVELCAVVVHPDIMCPINFPFNLSFSMAEGTGIYQVFLILMFLYIFADSRVLFFDVCERRVCVQLHVSVENFTFQVARTEGLDTRISLSTVAGIQLCLKF